MSLLLFSTNCDRQGNINNLKCETLEIMKQTK